MCIRDRVIQEQFPREQGKFAIQFSKPFKFKESPGLLQIRHNTKQPDKKNHCNIAMRPATAQVEFNCLNIYGSIKGFLSEGVGQGSKMKI